MKQIIAIGGGGFGREIGELKIEKYIVKQSNKSKPKICFIPTATGDDQGYIDNFYKAFDSLNCITSHIDFFKIASKPHSLHTAIILLVLPPPTYIMSCSKICGSKSIVLLKKSICDVIQFNESKAL